MAQRDRSKEFWLIPKRVSLHQTICLIDGIVERNYNKTSWNPQKQNNLGVNLKKWGATKDGKNVSPQSIRTLTASLPQYLGFVYINTNTTPNTICITPMGEKLLNYHKPNLVKIPNLILGKDNIITESEIVLQQMTKLQITNPVILKDCENVFVFPFRLTLKLIKSLGYLDREEIAYFLFKTKDESELELRIQEIINFRKLSIEERSSLINKFKNTHLGNISLVQAPSSAYYENLCLTTGIVELIKITPTNRNSNINAIRIKKEYSEFVDKLLAVNSNVETFDFKDDLDLWIEYIGCEEHTKPPFEIIFKNFLNEDCLIEIKDTNKSLYIDMIEYKNQIAIPVFDNVKYRIICSSCDTGKTIYSKEFTFDYKQRPIELSNGQTSSNQQVDQTAEELAKRIIEHSNSQNFDSIMLKKLQALNKCFKIDKLQDKNLRGAYYEYLFFKLLSILKNKNIIDDVFWNGKIGKFGLPVPAPGGKTGTPDIIFKIDDFTYILELTTIKSKSQQFSAELASVPDHIRLFDGENVTGIFVAPIIHERNTNAMNSVLSSYNKKLHCLTDDELLKILLTQDRTIIKNALK